MGEKIINNRASSIKYQDVPGRVTIRSTLNITMKNGVRQFMMTENFLKC